LGVVYKAPQKVILTDPEYPSASRCFSDFVWQISDRLESNAHHHTRFHAVFTESAVWCWLAAGVEDWHLLTRAGGGM